MRQNQKRRTLSNYKFKRQQEKTRCGANKHRDERIRISFYHKRNEGKDKMMAESLDQKFHY